MTNIVEFPGLGWSFEISRVAFTVFGVPIYWYGVFIGLGVVLAILFAFSQAKRFGIDSDRMIDVIMIGILSAIIGGRLYFVIFSAQEYKTFFDLINLRDGGIGFYGAAIAAFVGAGLACKWRKVPMGPLFDLAGFGFLIGQTLGRWGNFFNQEAFGGNTKLPWGMISPATTNYLTWEQTRLQAEGMMVNPMEPVHPTFLYESLWCLLGFLLLMLYKNRRRFNGEICLMYIMWYGLGRTFIESMRTDSLWISGLGLRVSQVVGVTSFLLALALWIVARVRTAGKPLVVPALPDHSVRVKIANASKRVLVSWPNGEPEPSDVEKYRMALELWTRQQAADAAVPEGETLQDIAAAAGVAKDETSADDEAEVVLDDKAERLVVKAQKAEEKAQKAEMSANKAEEKAQKTEEKAQKDVGKARAKAGKAAEKAEKAEDKAEKIAEKAEKAVKPVAEKVKKAADKPAKTVEKAVDKTVDAAAKAGPAKDEEK